MCVYVCVCLCVRVNSDLVSRSTLESSTVISTGCRQCETAIRVYPHFCNIINSQEKWDIEPKRNTLLSRAGVKKKIALSKTLASIGMGGKMISLVEISFKKLFYVMVNDSGLCDCIQVCVQDFNIV